MKTDLLPESEHVEDRRGEKGIPQTLNEMAKRAEERKKGHAPDVPPGPEYSDSDLAKQAGIGDIGKA